MVSLSPTSVDIKTIVLGNILAITPYDAIQLLIISIVSIVVLGIKWKDFLIVFFDENHAVTIGLNPNKTKIIFFTILSACTVAALQTVGAFLVIALVVTPGATAYLLSDKFGVILTISSSIGVFTCMLGAYLSFFIDGYTGGVIVILQAFIFVVVFLFAPKHGYFNALKLKKNALQGGFDG